MRRIILTSIIGILLISSQLWAAEVTKVEISHNNGVTQAQIDVDGPIRYMHQTEVPKNGKPYRVIIDILSATHELGGKVYENLPPCPISSIRSSQFAVKPEKVVRIVFDMKDELVYRIDNNDKAITVVFSHPAIPAFAAWSTSGRVNEKKIVSSKKLAAAQGKQPPKASQKKYAQTNIAIERDRLTSLAGESPAAAKPTTSKSATSQVVSKKQNSSPTVPLPNSSKLATVKEKPKTVAEKPKAVTPQKTTGSLAKKVSKPQPKSSTKSTQAKVQPKPAIQKPTSGSAQSAKVKSDKKSTPVVAKKEQSKKATAKSKATTELAPKKATGSQTALAKKINKQAEKPKSTPKAASKKQLANSSKSLKSNTPSKSPNATKKKSSSKQVAKADKAKDDSKKSTSRFRRSSGASAKIKGTMVAEFPRRLTIKYKATRHADPFRVLIDKTTQASDHPVERRTPNIEGLKLVGVIESAEGANRALFEDNEGYGYMLKAGDKVRNGYVLRVDSDQVHFQIFEYGWSRTVALKMD